MGLGVGGAVRGDLSSGVVVLLEAAVTYPRNHGGEPFPAMQRGVKAPLRSVRTTG
ncbi:MAG: hypothetical protein M3272_03320 [Actinomycetota bacterium]|nr:hypothetical protein [Actinomycetota bacterium]